MKQQMIASHHAGPTQVVFNITNRCNMNCAYCFNSSTAQGVAELTDEEVLAAVHHIADDVRPYNVCFSGGEPLLRFDVLCDCIHILRARRVRSNLLTNGVLLDAKRLRLLAKCGLSELEVSLDGSDISNHERFRAPGSFRKVCEALKVLRDMSLVPYGVSLVLTSFNLPNVQCTIRLLQSFRTPSLLLRPLLAFGRALGHLSQDMSPTPMQYRRLRSVLERYTDSAAPRVMFLDPLSHIFSFGAGLPFFGMEIKANGDLIISPYFHCTFGSIRRHSILDYWDAGWPHVWALPPAKKFVERVTRNEYALIAGDAVCHKHYDLIDDV